MYAINTKNLTSIIRPKYNNRIIIAGDPTFVLDPQMSLSSIFLFLSFHYQTELFSVINALIMEYYATYISARVYRSPLLK